MARHRHGCECYAGRCAAVGVAPTFWSLLWMLSGWHHAFPQDGEKWSISSCTSRKPSTYLTSCNDSIPLCSAF